MTSSAYPGRGYRVTNPRPHADSLGGVGSESRVLQRYRQAKDNEARWDGRRKSHTLIVPVKQGNLPAGTLGMGRGVPRYGTVGGQLDQGFELGLRVTATSTGSTAVGEAITGRTGCLNWARPDLWEGWEVTPTPTRQVTECSVNDCA